MIKQLILLIQVLGLFFYQLIFTGDLTVTQKLPESIAQGTEAIVEITIKKNNITGFAKVQQIFPEGFTAVPVETKGATFSFKDNKIKFIWMALPSESEFTISYKIKPNQNTIGDFILGGKFSFISESERKNIEIPVANFSVVGDDVIADNPIVEDPIVEDPVVESITITCNRTITNIEEGKYTVTVEIDKKGIKGFAKITEQIPNGFVAIENDSKGGVFSFRENEVKILWMAAPKNDTYTISYIITANQETETGNYDVKGYFSYLENDITSKYDIDLTSFKLKREQIIADNPVVENLVEKDPVTNTTNNREITSTPTPENGISYKVQVGAGHKKVASSYFSAKFNLRDNVSTINHEGWIKYLVGKFSEYKLARDKRNKVRNNIKTAFVTAYNSGKRITVQEALMISNQKWYK